MTYLELQASFELEINKIDANLEKPKSVDIEYWLNRGLEKFYKTRYTGVNVKGLGFEQDQKRIDDLRTLISVKSFDLDRSYNIVQEKPSASEGNKILIDDSWLELEQSWDKIYKVEKNGFAVRLPKDYVVLLGDQASIEPTRAEDIQCAERDEDGNIIPWTDDTIEATIETIDKQLRNSLSEHRIKYNRARPLRLIRNNIITLYTDNNYDIVKYNIHYLRRPKEIDIHKDPRGQYEDMPEHTHYEIVKLAVQMYLENQTNNRYETYSNEVNYME